MNQTRDVYQQLAARTGRNFLNGLRALPEFKPAPGIHLVGLQVTVTVVDGPDLGSVVMDPINLGDLADIAARRAEGLRAKHARLAGKPHLRLVGEGA